MSRTLTFQGFLLRYCKELSGIETASIKKLSRLATSDVPRLVEPLFFLAAETDCMKLLLACTKNAQMHDEYLHLAASDWREALENGTMPSRYQKVWNSYVAARDASKTNRRVITLMRERTLDGMKESGVTCYRLSHDLNLNKGNLYAYLNGGDVTKVSRETARKIMDHVCGTKTRPQREYQKIATSSRATR